MRDNQIMVVLRPLLLAGYVLQGKTGVGVKLAPSASLMAADSGPTLYITKLFDVPVGHPSRVSRQDPETLDMIHTETQIQERHFQATAVARPDPDPANWTALDWTASDYANAARAVLAGDGARSFLKASGLGILRIAQVRNPTAVNGNEQHEAFPSFDFVLTDEDRLVTLTPAVRGPPELVINRV